MTGGIEAGHQDRPDARNLAAHKDMPQGKRTISRSGIKEIIESHGKWYQNIRFGFMLETHHTRRSPGRQILAECRNVVLKALGRKTKEEALITSLADLTGNRVIDVGCNSGLYAVEASCRGADFVLGIDKNPIAIEQARAVVEIYRRLGKSLGRIEFRVGNINDQLELIEDMDTLMACCVLYHFGPLHKLKQKICKSKIRHLILQGNTARLGKIGEYNDPSSEFYEPTNQTWGNILCDIEGMRNFCTSMDFRVEKVMFPSHRVSVHLGYRATRQDACPG